MLCAHSKYIQRHLSKNDWRNSEAQLRPEYRIGTVIKKLYSNLDKAYDGNLSEIQIPPETNKIGIQIWSPNYFRLLHHNVSIVIVGEIFVDELHFGKVPHYGKYTG
ncbi:hypothetical protein PPYR_09596 [Photinus pyralis]|uniref:Uncharacterized protein n=1 Tax=Photinus pyralis TaxID=7054 RepID=A0A1Y1N2U6_PHOPY|nr:hypothetical protein PPYR_09596 [Photinus pyralis]